MTAESQTTGTIPPLPAWLYWTMLALAAAIPVLLVSGCVPSPWDAVLASINAALAVLTGTNRPASPAERAQLSALAAARKAARSTMPPPAVLLLLCPWPALASCYSLAPVGGQLEVGAVDDPSEISDYCEDLDSAYIGTTAAAAVLNGTATAAAGALAIWPDPTRNETIAVGVTGMAAGVIGAALDGVAAMLATRYVDRCTGGP